MVRPWFTVLGIVMVMAAAAGRAAPVAEVAGPVVSDVLHPLPPGAVRAGGELGRQLELCRAGRIEHQDIEALIQPFRDRRDKYEWRSEFWGKWFTSAVAAWRYDPDDDLAALLDQAAEGLAATQSADGYLGSYPDGGRRQRWDIWGRKYTLLGLLAWHEQTAREAYLTAAQRQADLLLAEVGPGGASPFENDMWHGLASSSVLEPMALLYRRTGELRYLSFAKYLVDLWATPEGPDLVRKALAGTPVFEMFEKPQAEVKGYGSAGKSKSYEMMSCYEGLTELYRSTGEAEFRDAVLQVYDNIGETELTVIGSGSDWERWCDGRRRQTVPWHKGMETCVTVTWIKLAAQLLRLTGDPRYADDIERSAYNALFGAQAVDGTWWCHHTPLAGLKERAPTQCGMEQNCCVANGPRGLMLLPQLAIMTDHAGPVINFYEDATATADLPGGNHADLVISGGYPRSESVTIQVRPDRPAAFTLKLRIPAWSDRTTLTVNGEALPAKPGTYADLTRRWQAGDEVRLTLDLRARVVHAPGDERFAAVERGPLVLARDRRLDKGELDGVAPLAAVDGFIELQPASVARPDHVAMAFNAPLTGGGTVQLCDFASAGNTWTDASRYRVWLPQTGTPAGQPVAVP